MLLKKQSAAQHISNHKKEEQQLIGHILRADKSAQIPDFIHMLAELVSKVCAEEEVTLDPDEGHISNDTFTKLGHPYICYSILSREPKMELKPRKMERVKDSDGRWGQEWLFSFASTMQFNIFAGDYITADKVMSLFEELMFRYTAYFKKNGVSEIIFLKQLTDKNFEQYRQSCSVRSLQYRIDTQRVLVDYDATIQDIMPVSSN